MVTQATTWKDHPVGAVLYEMGSLPFAFFSEVGEAFGGLRWKEAKTHAFGTSDEKLVLEINHRIEAWVYEYNSVISEFDSGKLSISEARVRLNKLMNDTQTTWLNCSKTIMDPALQCEVWKWMDQFQGDLSDLQQVFDRIERGEGSAKPRHTGSSMDPELIQALGVLGLAIQDIRELEPEVVEKAFKTKMRFFHPDRHQDESMKAFFDEEMKRINSARDLVKSRIGK